MHSQWFTLSSTWPASCTGVSCNPSSVVKYTACMLAAPVSPLDSILLTFYFKQWYWQPLKEIKITSKVKENMLQLLCNHTAMFQCSQLWEEKTILFWKETSVAHTAKPPRSLRCLHPSRLFSIQAQVICTQWFGQNFMQRHRKARQSLYQAFITTCF